MHYLDNAATTQVAQAVADEADSVLRAQFANPASLYAPGAQSEAILTAARVQVAKSLGCAPAQVVFTSGGTEGNNIAIRGAVQARSAWARQIVATGYEHPSVQNTVAALEKEGWQLVLVPPNADGVVNMARLVEAVTPETALVAAMHVNNETGAVLDVAALAAAVKAKNNRTAIHADGVQAWRKLPLALAKTQLTSYTVSGHKIHAPKGIGALYLAGGAGQSVAPTLFGGRQENGFRPGTENLAYAAALAKAAAMQPVSAAHCERLRTLLLEALATMEGVALNSPQNALPCVVNFSVEGIKSETMLHFLESREIYVSSGSACSKGAPSHTLTAMGLSAARVDSAIRVSFCADTTAEDVRALTQALREGASRLARVHQ